MTRSSRILNQYHDGRRDPRRLLALLSLCALALAACGEAGTPERDGDATADGRAAGAGGDRPAKAAAAQTAEDALPRLKCPAKVDRALEGPDIVGLKLGMSRDSALMLVRCHMKDEGHLAFEKTWLPKINSHQLALGPQAFSIQRGDSSPCSFRTYQDMQKCGRGNRVWDFVSESITVAAPGLPGSETVVGIWRTQGFRPGEMPVADDLKAALVRKYGPFQWEDVRTSRNGNYNELGWQFDLAGQPVTSGNPLFAQCARNIASKIDRGASWTEGCGLTIRAEIAHSAENPALARELSIGMLHQDDLFAYGNAIQAELDRIEEERRAAELARQKSSAPDVKL
ncbi:MAG: hypothetical protein Kow00104_21050 [Rhodothalassiaceae bacterium]